MSLDRNFSYSFVVSILAFTSHMFLREKYKMETTRQRISAIIKLISYF